MNVNARPDQELDQLEAALDREQQLLEQLLPQKPILLSPKIFCQFRSDKKIKGRKDCCEPRKGKLEMKKMMSISGVEHGGFGTTLWRSKQTSHRRLRSLGWLRVRAHRSIARLRSRT